MSSTSRAKKINVLDKKIPENPKYKHVKATVDTGSSVTKYMERIEDMRKNYKFRKDEIFKRMKVSTFAQLVLQVAQVIQVEEDRENLISAAGSEMSDTSTLIPDEKEMEENVPPLILGDENERPNTSGTETSRSTLHGLIHGVGEIDMKDKEKQDNNPQTPQVQTSTYAPDIESMPYLLLDIREKDAFDKCHIIGALNYPASMLSRSYNYFTKEILMFKNKVGKIIILYDEDERLTGPSATTFVQREVDNLFVLSGGLKVLAKKFGDCMITGKLPASCIPTPPPSRKGSGKQRLPQPSTPGTQQHYNYFTYEQLEKIQEKLDDELLSQDSKSRLSSRVSSRSAVSSASSRLSTASSASSNKKSVWK
ncbi:centrosomal protein of 41 kDa-like [Actinia tenebrosa]|uniref:Centrosomal protein of 41 kDa-like n=1 Tax=Actinia tenebrosa TaxID=6105 RepID=A0A6P8IXS2_ACTTE|nr:centrosomal protein of 41 kDa-like [Actinia tenebrosa]